MVGLLGGGVRGGWVDPQDAWCRACALQRWRGCGGSTGGGGGAGGETKGDDGGASAASAASAVGEGAGDGASESGEEGGAVDAAGGGSVRYQWDAFVATGAAVEDAAVEASAGAVKPGQCASIIMSSGTESNPKSVMLSHDNLTWTARSLKAQMEAVDIDTLISFLPLSSGFVQVIDIHMAVATGFQVTFARPDALRGSLATTMKEVRSGV